MYLQQNQESAPWVIQKFGGTSIGKFAVKIAEDIVPAYLPQDRLALVCSARSGSTKSLGTTSLLLQAAAEALRQPALGRGSPTGSYLASSRPWSPSLWKTSQLAARTENGSPGTETFPSTPRLVITPTSDTLELEPFVRTVELIRTEHVNAARELVRDPDLLCELENEIQYDCEALQEFLHAARVIGEISSRSRDNILGVGEKLSCKLVTTVLRDRGIDAEFVSLESIVPDYESDADECNTQLDQAFYDSVAKAVGERLEQCGPRIPVVTGFFGPVPGSLLAQVGRGYTDLIAALAAVGTNARELQVWKEVDGIFTADPRKVSTARLLTRISPDEAAELTYYGSEVIHPLTMTQAIRARIPIRIKNVERPKGSGTVVDPDRTTLDGLSVPDIPRGRVAINKTGPVAISIDVNATNGVASVASQRFPTAVTIKEHILVFNVRSNRRIRSHGFLASVFSSLDRHRVVVDLISTSEVSVSMAIAIPPGTPRSLARVMQDLHGTNACTLSLHPSLAILSLVGRKMRDNVGIAGRMFDALAREGINIEMISQGASDINISCVVKDRDASKALNLIHEELLPVRGDGEW
ncbi:aspartate kinase [Ceratobasidium sp. AG-I]|nr:aspartate kinase [Ceratobasidium sp. AG-I]